MRVRHEADFPDGKRKLRQKAIRLQWMMLGFMLTVILVLYLVMGNSQALKAAWLEDLLSLVPPAAFLIATAIERRGPTKRFPFGFYRAVSIGYLVSSVALLAMGLFLLFDSLSSLLAAHHPTIGGIEIFGYHVWLGWPMIAALAYSMVPPVVIGRLTMPVAEELHDKALYAGAEMAKADWMTALAAIAGIVGIGFGIWWADAAAALIISVDILRDGGSNVWAAVKDLSDEVPTRIGSGDQDPVLARLEKFLRGLDWVESAEVQLREEGRFLTGAVYVVPNDRRQLQAKLERARQQVLEQDWRLYDIAVMPVSETSPPPS